MKRVRFTDSYNVCVHITNFLHGLGSSDDLASKYHKSVEHRELHNVIDPILANYKAEKDVRDYPLWNRWCHKYETNFFWQVQKMAKYILFFLLIFCFHFL